MKLWILRPIENAEPWKPWYDVEAVVRQGVRLCRLAEELADIRRHCAAHDGPGWFIARQVARLAAIMERELEREQADCTCDHLPAGSPHGPGCYYFAAEESEP